VHVLGCNPSDIDLTIPLLDRDIPHTFYFLGDPEEIEGVTGRNIVISKKRGAPGAADILSYIYKSDS
jgi:hypothetical protein